MKRPILATLILLLLQLRCFSVPGQQQSAQVNRRSCREFVQSFYDWYAKRPNSSRALKERRSAFSPELFRALKDDEEAQAKSPSEIVGLDEDPILSGNDRPPGERFVVDRISLAGETTCWVELDQVWSGGKTEKLVAAKVVSNAEGWHFVNFYYSDLPNSDLSASVSRGGLLTILKNLREVRERAAKAQPMPQQQDSVPSPKIKTAPRK